MSFWVPFFGDLDHQLHSWVERKTCLFCLQHPCLATILHYNFIKNTTETITIPKNTSKQPTIEILSFWNLLSICNQIPNCLNYTKTALQHLLSHLSLANGLHYTTHSYTTETVTKISPPANNTIH